MSSRVAVFALLVAASGFPGASRAVDCVYRAIAPGTTVTHDGSRFVLDENWVATHRCEDVAVATGRAGVRRPRQSGGIVKTEVEQGRYLASSREDGGSPVWDEIASIVSGDAHLRAGRSRGTEADDALDAALPRGKVTSRDGASIDVPLPAPAGKNGAVFVLSQDGRTVWQTRLTESLLAIPAPLLVAGQRYRWSYAAADRQLAGDFVVVESRASTEALDRPGDDEDASDPLWTRAVRLRNAGFEVDARRTLREWLSR